MFPYFLLYTYLVVFLIFSKNIKTHLFYYLSFFILVIFSSLRFDIGMDFMNYYFSIDDFKEGKALFLFEPLNMVIIDMINYFDMNKQIFFIIYAIFTLLGIFYFIKKLSPSKELSVFIFVTAGIFYFSTFNGLRQWMAISIVLIGLVKLIEKKNIEFFLYVFLASLFHLSALIALLLFFIKRRFDFLQVLIFAISLYIGSIFMIDIISHTKYIIYLEELKFDKSPNPILLIAYVLIFSFIPIFLGYFSKEKALSSKEIILSNMNLCSIFILLIGYLMNIDFLTLMRVNMYFTIQLIILIPIFFENIQNENIKNLFILLTIIFFSFYFFYTLYFNGIEYNLTPYKTFLWSEYYDKN